MYLTRDPQLLSVLHKFHGGVCYTPTPHLLEAVCAFELNLENGENDRTEVLYKNLLKSLDMLEIAYQTQQLTKSSSNSCAD
jgi:hypothetical protein